MPLNIKPNQEFLKFISLSKDQNQFPNVEMLLYLEKNYIGIFAKVMADFDKVVQSRKSINENGKVVRVPWETAMIKFYADDRYSGITDENADIAALFAHKGLSQNLFSQTSKLRKEAKEKNIPEHIVGKHLREENILESIKRLKKQTELELVTGKELLDNLYDKQFTYEWLSKNDPSNAIIGLYCSCCATINNQSYGKEIVRASILNATVQNIVVRNSKGEIISKGVMYVDKKRGYGIINDFELNDKYRRNEEYITGRYEVSDDDYQEQEREMIFKAFLRGIKAFAKEYDVQNPNNPLQKVNVGMGYNKLKRQVERFKKETKNVTVPVELGFYDAAREQYTIYERVEREKDKDER